jgi:cytochrome c oxidase subunit II
MGRLTRSITRSAAARVFLALALAVGAAAGLSAAGRAEQPHDWQIGMQPPATSVDQQLQEFHDILLWIIFAITAFVLILLIYVMVRYNARRHPVPSRTSHNAVVEILWTVVPVLILVFIAIPSFKLMYYMDRVPKGAMTIKVTGHQWYWSYAYPAEKITFNSNLVPEKALKPGQPRLLTVDNPLVVPAHTNVRVLVTSTDVIHSWFVPAFGVQEYAVIGRDNQAWFNVDRPGTYYGECNQICGINHSHMAVEVVALSQPDWQKWLAQAKKKFAMAPPQDAVPIRRPTRVATARPAGN